MTKIVKLPAQETPEARGYQGPSAKKGPIGNKVADKYLKQKSR